MEEKLQNFINNKRAVRFFTVVILFFISLHFLFISVLEIDLIREVLSLGSEGLNRLVSLAVGIFVAIVTYGAYRQDREIVNTRLKELKQRIAEEAKEIRAEVATKANESTEEIQSEETLEEAPKEEKKTKAKKTSK